MAAKNQEQLAGEMLESIIKVLGGINRSMVAELIPFGITLTQFVVLKFVRRNPGISLSDLARQLNVEPPSASRMVDKMLAKGLLEKTPDTVDRRAVHISLTREGTRLVDRLERLERSLLAAKLSRGESRETEAMVLALKRLSERWSQ